MACQAEISVAKYCDATTMTDGTSSLSVTSASQTESLITSFYEFERMSTREQVSCVQRLFDQICCKLAIPTPKGFIHSAVTSIEHLHKRRKSNVIAGLASALGVVLHACNYIITSSMALFVNQFKVDSIVLQTIHRD